MKILTKAKEIQKNGQRNCPKHMPPPTKVALVEETLEDAILQLKGFNEFLNKAIEKKAQN